MLYQAIFQSSQGYKKTFYFMHGGNDPYMRAVEILKEKEENWSELEVTKANIKE